MKRRSFIVILFACFGIKLEGEKLPEPTGYGTWTMLSPEFISLERDDELDKVISLRMDQAGEYAREQLAKSLCYQTRRTKFHV